MWLTQWFREWFSHFPLFPQQASTMAGQVDALYGFLILVSLFFTGLVAFMVVYFSIRYRKERNPVASQIEGSNALEIFWTAVPLAISMVIFVWGAVVYFNLFRPPDNPMEVYVVGKQWMWKTEQPSGVREINQLHIPVNRPVRLTMISQDVIHSFFVPAFRIKHDVLPGRYTYAWFEATKPGTYHLFCAEYCGTQHSGMVGQIIAMEPAQYQAWLAGGSAMGSLSSRGQQQFTSLGCVTCHSGEPGARGPNLFGVFGKNQPLADGRVVKVDEDYVRESILNPTAKVVAGFQPIMPTFAGQVSEETLIELVAYIKTLQEQQLQGTAAAASGNIRPIPEKKVPLPKSKKP